ncbi:Uroporphyrinogen-III Synthase [Seminavis robusta]|uniref:Uroporphyrinogen-III synthase n=1 Tax=Seminavis robusta TaxID=568900 RepID=A0A9N8HHA6_9STRA|nr:Uroporphyrinogen-III Synthase [Seminavis robusta]|eukprot:Sro526_g160450.1 Uroporphyrinogen-III Synthase (315) ;mRNA; r:40195-41139
MPMQQSLFLLSLLLSRAACFLPAPRKFRVTVPYQSSSSSFVEEEGDPILIALTREEGKNDKLRHQLTQQLLESNDDDSQHHKNVQIVELPCIAHADGPDFDKLQDTLINQPWDYVTITSPEAARVLASAWSQDAFGDHPVPKVAAVGKATQETLTQAGIPVAFCPSKATAKVLVKELPAVTSTRVLYPASARAQTTLQDGLAARGFKVTRLNTYDTVTAMWTDEQTKLAAKTQIVCVASPSSIKGWLANSNASSPPFSFAAACIGETSAKACRELGFEEDQIFYPDKPGIPGWVQAVQEALEATHPASTTIAAQ